MDDTGTNLDAVFNQPADLALVEAVTPPDSAPAAPVDMGEPVVPTPPVATPAEPDHVPRTALMDERRKRQEFERRAAEAEQNLQRFQQAQQRQQAPQQQPQQQPKGINQQDFGTQEAYLDAVAEAKANEIFDRRMQAAERERQERSIQQATTADMVDLFSAGRAKYADFDAVATNPGTPITEAMQNAMLAIEGGHEVAYSLGMNFAEASRIANLPPSSQAREIGKLARALAAANAPVVLTPPVVPPLPKTLTQTRAAGGQFTSATWTGPTPLDSIARRK